MQPSRPIETDIVLLGAGHAHLEVLRRFAQHQAPGVRLTLIGREPETPYSGMLPGLIRTDYQHDQAHIDLAPLAAMAGARLIIAEATGIDPEARTVSIAGRPDLPFDLLSVDIGGTLAVPPEAGVPVKPIGRFLAALDQIEAECPPGSRLAVVGGGVAGTELTLALAARFGGHFQLLLVADGAEPIATAPASARRIVRQALMDAGVEVICGVAATGLAHGHLILSDGSAVEAASAFWTTGVHGAPFLAASGLACDEAGCIRVTPALNSISHPHVFAAGDCASLEGGSRPKAGVWAVRAGEPLEANLRRAASGERLQPWRPQREALVILGLGHGRAVAWRNGLAFQGRAVWRWKDRIDRRWMSMYQDMRMPPPAPEAVMRCGGCGAKVGAEVLAGALATLPAIDSPDVLSTRDDAAVLKPPVGRLLVQSVDYFRSFIDDPYVFGQIAAAHALSDLYAMGADPWTALAVASVAYASGAKMRLELTAMLRGATDVLQAEGCILVGGHSAEGSEPGLGFSVSGLAEPGRVLRKGGLQPHDRLILTKRLGTGIVLAGHMRGDAKAQWLTAAIESMRSTNAVAARIGRSYYPHAATDITGFGLAGHLMEMLAASEMSAVLRLDAIPVLPGAQELAARGIESTLAPQNRAMLGRLADVPELALLTDPQTSGGLLLGIPPEQAPRCLEAMLDAGLPAAVIGEVEAATSGPGGIRLVKS